MLALTSLRFGDARSGRDLWVSYTALCGPSVNIKEKSGQLMTWATPLAGLRPKSRRYEHLIKFWTRVKPKEGKFAALFPHIIPEWEIDYGRSASTGVAQPKLDVIRKELGF